MSERISSREFLHKAGNDWRAIVGGGWGVAHYRTGSYASDLAFVAAVGEIALAADHRVDVDLRPTGVSLRVFSGDHNQLSSADVEIAQQISTLARQVQAVADPSAVQHVQIALDALDISRVQPFWAAVLGFDPSGDEDVLDPMGRLPSFWFQQMDEPRTERNRFHIDLYLAHDQAESRIAAALAAGGRMMNDAHAPHWWTLADPEGNEVDVAIWMDF